MTSSRFAVLAVAAACWIAPAIGRAGPPYATDDPEPVEPHHWELYLATQGGWDRDHTLAFTLPHVELNYGVGAGAGVQLHFIAPMQYVRPAGVATGSYGYGDTELGAKIRVLREGDLWPQVGTFPLVEVPTGDSSRGLGAGRTRVFLPLWLQKSAGRWLSYGGGGYWINPGAGNRNWWFAGWHLEARLGAIAPGFEIFHGTSQREGEPGETRFNAGAVIDLTSVHHVLLSAGRVLESGAPAVQFYAGYQLTIGPAEQPKIAPGPSLP